MYIPRQFRVKQEIGTAGNNHDENKSKRNEEEQDGANFSDGEGTENDEDVGGKAVRKTVRKKRGLICSRQHARLLVSLGRGFNPFPLVFTAAWRELAGAVSC
jgi:hypothetical protein